MSIGQNIKRYRKEKGLTQKELGEAIGKKEITIRKYENDSINPSIDIIKKISEVLNVDMTFLLDTDENFVDFILTDELKISEKGFIGEALLLLPFDELLSNLMVQKYFEYDYDKLSPGYYNEMLDFLISAISFKINELKKHRNFTSNDYKEIEIYIDNNDDDKIKARRPEK